MMDVFYLLPPDSCSALWTEGQRRPSVNTHCIPCVCVCVCVYMCTCDILAAVPSLTRVPRAEDSGCSLPSHLPQRWFCTPALASLTGGVATVMDDCALGFCVRVPHPCYLPGGPLSKTSCWVSCFCRLFCSPSAS